MRRLTISLVLLTAALICQPPASADDLVSADGKKALARVGDELILEQDVVAFVDQAILDFEQSKKIPANQFDKVRKKLIEDRTNHLVEVRLVVLDIRQQLPSEQLGAIKTALAEEFETKEVPIKLREQGLHSRQELEKRAAKGPMSLDSQKQTYIEDQMALGWIATHLKHPQQPATEKESMRRKVATREYLDQLREHFPVKMTTDE